MIWEDADQPELESMMKGFGEKRQEKKRMETRCKKGR